ncbi:putative ribonucleoside-diphosphate reductase [Helianthus anomalus]
MKEWICCNGCFEPYTSSIYHRRVLRQVILWFNDIQFGEFVAVNKHLLFRTKN